MRPRRLKAIHRVFVLVGLGAILAASTGVARANGPAEYADEAAPIICEVIHEYPSVGGVEGVIQGVINDTGFSPYQAGQVVGTAVATYCPELAPILRRYIAVYTSQPTTGRLGGVLR